MIRAVVVMLGFLLIMAGCSQFDQTPTAPAPNPDTATPVPAPTPTPAIDFAGLWWDCHILYRQEELGLLLRWNAGSYNGDFFLPREMAWDRLEEPPKSFDVHCLPMDRSTREVWDGAEPGRFIFYLDCSLSSLDAKGTTSFVLSGPLTNSWYITFGVDAYLPLNVAWEQSNQRGLFQMQMVCVPMSYPDG